MKIKEQDSVVIRLAGDSGDGMQLIGTELANTSALFGNDIGTLPDFPAEIRAPRGTIAGVSGYQLHIGSFDIHTPGDEADCLVAMNPAALKSNIKYLKPNAALILDTFSFNEKNLKLAGYKTNPLDDSSLDAYQTFKIDITQNTRKILDEFDLGLKDKDRCKNFYALGVISWLFNRPLDHAVSTLEKKFKSKATIKDANILSLRGGYAFCEMTETSLAPTLVNPAKLDKGKYRSITGNTAVAIGLVAASEKSGMGIFYSGYPITPASEILHEMFKYEGFGIKIFQAEDEIAAVGAAVGASYTGKIGVTASSGPGIALKSETISLAIMTELPLVVINVQRSGPSTGMPTKTEQADLNMALFGRHGEASMPVIAASRSSDCFETIYEAARISVKYRIPVMFLSDGYIANGSEPWLIPDSKELKDIQPFFATDSEYYQAYTRNPETLARNWATPGMKGFEHRIGGLEKSDLSGEVSYDPDNHHQMTLTRNEKLERIKNDMLDLYQDGNNEGDILVIGWGSTYGAIRTAIEQYRREISGKKITHIHLKWLNPLNKQVDLIINNFKHVIVPEINLGQIRRILRARFLIDIHGFNLIRGLPFTATEIFNELKKYT